MTSRPAASSGRAKRRRRAAAALAGAAAWLAGWGGPPPLAAAEDEPAANGFPLSVISGLGGGEWDIAGEAAVELRLFPGRPAFADQENTHASPSLRLEPELYYEWNGGDDRLTLTPMLRWDANDRERSHIDLRQANWLHIGPDWDLVLGIEQVFWGVTESAHLVDIINQTDQVEDTDNEDKLGQPMVNLNLERDSGTYSLFILPGFRKQRFPDSKARLRGRYPVDWNNAVFEDGASESRVDFALRWAATLGDWDIGLSHFHGVSREPLMRPVIGPGGLRLRPVYKVIDQTGLDLQYTTGAWLWKLEAITRSGHGERFGAAVGGFEYTLFGLAESTADLGLLMEIHIDGRDAAAAPATIGDHDIFAGARLAFNDENDTEILAGVVVDWENATTLANIEAGRRIGQHYEIEANARLFFNAPDAEFISGIQDDDFIRLDLIRHF